MKVDPGLSSIDENECLRNLFTTGHILSLIAPSISMFRRRCVVSIR